MCLTTLPSSRGGCAVSDTSNKRWDGWRSSVDANRSGVQDTAGVSDDGLVGAGLRGQACLYLVVTVAAAFAAFLTPQPAGATIRTATDADSFAVALGASESGDTIMLVDGQYPILSIVGSHSVTIKGSRNARVAGVSLWRSSAVTLEGFTVAPPGSARAVVLIKDSDDVTLDNVLIDGRDERVGAGILTRGDNSDFVIKNSEITNCGDKNRCIGLTRGTVNTLILNNAFHDCFDCDFIRSGASGVTIKGNTFDRAIPGSCKGGPLVCNHNDHVQIAGGGPWTVIGNRFGVKQGGAASIYVNPGVTNKDNPIHDVRIESNYFSGDAGLFGLKIGDDKIGLMSRISVVNNTIMSGDIAALQIERGWRNRPLGERPRVANNVFAIMSWPSVCRVGQFFSNLTITGVACKGGEIGPAKLGPDGRPTAGSSLVIDNADSTYAPLTDYSRSGRLGPPDRGAFEFLASQPPSSPPPGGVDERLPRVTTLTQSLSAFKRRLEVYAQVTDDVGTSEATLSVDGASLASKTFENPSDSAGVSFSLPLRRIGRGKHTIRVTAADAESHVGIGAFGITIPRTSLNPRTPRVTTLIHTLRNLADEAIRVRVVAELRDDRAVRKAIFFVDGRRVKSRRFRVGVRSAITSFRLTEWYLPHGHHIVRITAVDKGGRRGSAWFSLAVR
jgi:parallel beta helix pectate lyase-like protein